MEQPRQYVQVFTGSLLISLLSTMMAFSFAAMMVHSTHPELLPNMVMAVLFSAVVSAAVVAWKGSLSGLIAAPLSAAAALFAEIFRNHEVTTGDVWLYLFLGGGITAIFLLMLGVLKLGRIVRYLPLPILAGFLSGVGWLFIKGGLNLVGVNQWLSSAWADSALWVAIVFGLILTLCNRYFSIAKLLPAATVIGGVIMVVLAPYWEGQQSWFFVLEQKGSLEFPIAGWVTQGWPEIQWLSLPWAELLTLVFISTLYLLLNATSVELKFKEELSLDHELKLAGILNLGLAATSGLHSALSLNQTSLAYDFQAKQRLTGYCIAVFLVVAMLFHEYLVRWLPIPLVAGILIFQGILLLNRWLVFSSDRFLKSDRIIIFVIFLVIIFNGYLGGVLVGLLLTVSLFVREYSRLQIIYFNTDLSGASSGVERTSAQHAVLKENAKQVRIYQLKGFVFFGSAHGLIEQIRTDTHQHAELEILVLDFHRVRNLDASAVNSLQRLIQYLHRKNLKLCFTGVNAGIHQRLQLNENIEFSNTAEPGKVLMIANLETALELIEDDLLNKNTENQDLADSSLLQIVKNNLQISDSEAMQLLSYFRQKHYQHNDWVIRQGAQDNTLYLLANGRVDVGLYDEASNHWVRFKKMLPGTMIGEMALYRQSPRSADAKAIGDTCLFELTKDRLELMERQQPELAIAFHRFVVLLETERLQESNKRVYSLLKT